ncbi:MAG: substrate-binding domain-containing protein [Gemmatimonadetes bacterium]|nr:substrate-binding domain-containing protein [Gemmatimonadota bacterium]
MRSSSVLDAAALTAALLLTPLAAGVARQAPGPRDVLLATTTSLYDTGLLDSLAPLFERQRGYRLRVVAVGSGQALRMAQRGDADVLLAHSPAAEEAFMRAGFGVHRLAVASNLFTIVGPPDDPAQVRAAPSAALALRQIADGGHRFVSRGDSSGTHQRELALWGAAGGRPAWPGYVESGQGMAATLLIADERRAYALTDRATYATLRRRLDLVPLREREAALLNVYHVIEVNPAGRPRVNADGARAFADWIVSGPVQDLLAHFGESRFGEPLFTPLRGREPSP